MHSSTSAPAHRRWAPFELGGAQVLAEEHHVGLQRAQAARQRGTPCSSSRISARASASATRPPQRAQEHVAMLPWTSTSSRVPARRWSMSTFCVTTPSSRPRALELDQRPVRAVGLLVLERREAVAVEVPEAVGVAAEGVDVRDLHRVDAAPTCRCRASGSRGSPRAPRCPRRSAPRPSSRRAPSPPGARAARARAVRRRAHARPARPTPRTAPHSPLKCGARLPRKAAMPSLASALANTAANARFSASMPSSRSPAPETRLICSTASGACPASLRAHGERGVEQFVIVDDAVDEPELERFVGQDRVADEVHLERLVGADEARQPLRAAEAGDDPELDLGLAEARRARRDAHVARHRQLAAAAERQAVDRRDRDDVRRRRARGTARARR